MKINKKLRYGGLSVAVTAVAVAIIVLINILVSTLLTQFDVKIDLSENRIYSIEESTAEYLTKLDDSIELIFASSESDFTSSTEFNQINEIAKKFAMVNGNISISYVDLLKNPSFSGEYGGDIGASDIIIKSNSTGRYKVLSQLEYFDVTYYDTSGSALTSEQAQLMYMYGMTYYTDVRSSAEQAFLSAIIQVSDTTPVRVAFTSGFGEGETYDVSSFISFLEKNTYTTETIDINLNEAISDEIDFVVIFTPSIDYTNEAMGKVASWLDNKGNYNKNLFYVPSPAITETPVLDAFMEEWGLKVEKGIAAQTNTAYASSGDPYTQYITLTDNDYTGKLSGSRFLGVYFRPITQLFTERSAFITTSLMTTYDGAIMRPFDSGDDWTPDANELTVLNVAAESNKTRYDSNSNALISRVFVFGGPYNFSASIIDSAQYANPDYYISIFNTLSGKEQGVVIKSKSYTMTTFQITAAQANTIAVIFCAVIPLLVIALGIFVYIRRRFR